MNDEENDYKVNSTQISQPVNLNGPSTPPSQQMPITPVPNVGRHFLRYIFAVIIIVAVMGGIIYVYMHAGISYITTTASTTSTTPTTSIILPNNTNTTENVMFNTILNSSNVLYGIPNSSSYNTSIETYYDNYKNESSYVYRRFYAIGGLYNIMANNSLPNQVTDIALAKQTANGTYPTAIKIDILRFNNSNNADRAYSLYYYPTNGTGYFYFSKNGSLIYNSTGVNTANSMIINESYYNTSVIGSPAILNGSDKLNGMIISSAVYGPIFRNYDLYQISTPPYDNYIIVIDAYFPAGKVNKLFIESLAYKLYRILEANANFLNK